MQSSALPLGHAAVRSSDGTPSVDRISRGNQYVLFISNGHGEDLISWRILKELHKLNPTLALEVLPLVGEGNAFQTGVDQEWLVKTGPSISLPSGGFSNQSFRGLLADLMAGLFSITWKQWIYVRWAALNGRKIVAIGDLLPLFFAWSSGASYSFIGTPKSDYTWISGPGNSLSDYYHRLKGTEWEPWEWELMKSSRCKSVAMRDKLTARGLRRHGVLAKALGNPMMDGFEHFSCPKYLQKYRRVLLLCGSRMPEARDSFKRILHGLSLVKSSYPLAILVATSSEPSLNVLEKLLRELGYDSYPQVDPNIGAHSYWHKGDIKLLLGPHQFSMWAAWSEIGLANAGTATEQLVGLGVPCVSLPGKGPQFKQAFAFRQSRLLGGVVAPCKTPEKFAQRIELLLRDELLRKRLGDFGKKRMGIQGGSLALASRISRSMLD